MIIALIISDMCFALLLKGVPTWFEIVLIATHAICNIVALIMWEETKSKIKALWKMKGGAE